MSSDSLQRDMEIVSYVLAGALQHKDSMGNTSVIRPGEVQRMSAGTGVTHSEYNPSTDEPVHFLQIWILPDRRGLPPGYEQTAFTAEERRGVLRLVASREGAERSVVVHQDVRLFSTILEPRQEVVHALAPGRHAWVQVARGEVTVDGHGLRAGDGAAVSDEREVRLTAQSPAEALVFDLG